jgi:PIN domain nuclease of toxin-antitoxin system
MTDPANELMFSAGSIWEIAVKVSVGKLALSLPYQAFVARAVTTLNLHILPVTVAYCDAQISLPFHHRDPFDRLIIAQAIVEQIPIASADPAFDAYPVTRLW